MQIIILIYLCTWDDVSHEVDLLGQPLSWNVVFGFLVHETHPPFYFDLCIILIGNTTCEICEICLLGMKISANEFESSLIVFFDLKNLYLDTKHNEIWQNLKISIFDPYASMQKRAWPKKQVPLSAWTVNFFLWYPETLNYHLEQEINCRNFVHGMANFVQKTAGLIV